jgi:hypothetical protein
MTAEYIGPNTTSKMLFAAVHSTAVPEPTLVPVPLVAAELVLEPDPLPLPLPLPGPGVALEPPQPPTTRPLAPPRAATEPNARAHTLIDLIIISPPYRVGVICPRKKLKARRTKLHRGDNRLVFKGYEQRRCNNPRRSPSISVQDAR